MQSNAAIVMPDAEDPMTVRELGRAVAEQSVHSPTATPLTQRRAVEFTPELASGPEAVQSGPTSRLSSTGGIAAKPVGPLTASKSNKSIA